MRCFVGPMTTVDASGERRRLPRPGGLDIALSILVAFNFAVAQPILDLTGRFPQFFLARRSPRIDLFLLAFGLAVLVPAVFALVVWLSSMVSRRFGTGLHVLVLGGLTATLGIQLLEQVPGLRDAGTAVLVAGASAVGAGAVVLYYRSPAVRSFVRIAAFSALLLPGLFLLSSDASRLVLKQSAAISGSSVIGKPVPVVMLVLDELPIASLMRKDHTIDAELFPAFAQLAAGSTWYRNATAVHDFTEIAMPAILSGSYGDKRKLPIASQYPKNIFTLLGGAYDVRAFEAFTQLCPLSICRSTTKPVPAGPVSCSISASPWAFRSSPNTRAPSLAKATALARPIPLPAPVTTATLPSSRPMSFHPLLRCLVSCPPDPLKGPINPVAPPAPTRVRRRARGSPGPPRCRLGAAASPSRLYPRARERPGGCRVPRP